MEYIELTTTDWTEITYQETEDDNGFSFWADGDVQFSEIPSPTDTQQVPLTAEIRYIFKKPMQFFVKGSIGTKIFLAPFDK